MSNIKTSKINIKEYFIKPFKFDIPYIEVSDIKNENDKITSSLTEIVFKDYLPENENIENETAGNFLYLIGGITRESYNLAREIYSKLLDYYKECFNKNLNFNENEIRKKVSVWTKSNCNIEQLCRNYSIHNEYKINKYLDSCEDENTKIILKDLFYIFIKLYTKCMLSVPKVEIEFEFEKADNIFDDNKMMDILIKGNGTKKKINFCYLPQLKSNGSVIKGGEYYVFTYYGETYCKKGNLYECQNSMINNNMKKKIILNNTNIDDNMKKNNKNLMNNKNSHNKININNDLNKNYNINDKNLMNNNNINTDNDMNKNMNMNMNYMNYMGNFMNQMNNMGNCMNQMYNMNYMNNMNNMGNCMNQMYNMNYMNYLNNMNNMGNCMNQMSNMNLMNDMNKMGNFMGCMNNMNNMNNINLMNSMGNFMGYNNNMNLINNLFMTNMNNMNKMNLMNNMENYMNNSNNMINNNNEENIINSIELIHNKNNVNYPKSSTFILPRINKMLVLSNLSIEEGINVRFGFYNGTKVIMKVSENITIKELLNKFLNKMCISNMKQLLFLFNGEELSPENEMKINERGIRNNILISVLEIAVVIGARQNN